MLEKKIPQYFTAGSLGRVGESLDLQLLPVAMASIFPPRVMSTHQPSALTKKGKWWGYCFCPGSSERVTCESPLSTQVTMADDYSDCTPHPRLTGQGMFKIPLQFSPSVISYSLQPCGLQHARLPCPITNSQSLLKLMSIELVMPSNHLILCRPLLLPPSIFPSIRVF